jgi:hypothetical protein
VDGVILFFCHLKVSTVHHLFSQILLFVEGDKWKTLPFGECMLGFDLSIKASQLSNRITENLFCPWNPIASVLRQKPKAL